MTDRVDQYLDGALDRIALSPEERADTETLERAIDEAREFVDARPAPDLTTRVMSMITQIGTPLARHQRSSMAALAGSLLAPRVLSLRIRPVYGLAAIAAIAVLAVFVPPVQWSAPRATQVEGAPKLFVQFRLQAVDASTVSLAGSFTNWQPQYELHQSAPGIWTVTLPLPLGVHDYAFVVDGKRWVADPYAPAVDDGFGGTNSRIALLPPDQPRS